MLEHGVWGCRKMIYMQQDNLYLLDIMAHHVHERGLAFTLISSLPVSCDLLVSPSTIVHFLLYWLDWFGL